MTQVLTVSCRLEVPAELKPRIDATMQAFARGCNLVRQTAEASRVTNKVGLQHLCYRQLREKFGLSSNLAIRAIARAAAALKAKHRNSKFHPTSVDYDQRIFRFRERDWTVSLTLIGGAERVRLALGDFQRKQLQGRHPTCAKLVKRKDGQYFLQIAIKHEPPEKFDPVGWLGVDLGIRNLASLSTGERFGGRSLDEKRDHYKKLRSALQRKGTKGAKRLLKRLSGRERRFMSWVNHTISARVVRFARRHTLNIALEDLSGIRSRVRVHKSNRHRLHRWAFYQLSGFMQYKALRDGVPLTIINPAFTSQTCHRCLCIGRRNGDIFKCEHCGFVGHADNNAACNISLVGACVTRPEHSLACHLAAK